MGGKQNPRIAKSWQQIACWACGELGPSARSHVALVSRAASARLVSWRSMAAKAVRVTLWRHGLVQHGVALTTATLWIACGVHGVSGGHAASAAGSATATGRSCVRAKIMGSHATQELPKRQMIALVSAMSPRIVSGT